MQSAWMGSLRSPTFISTIPLDMASPFFLLLLLLPVLLLPIFFPVLEQVGPDLGEEGLEEEEVSERDEDEEEEQRMPGLAWRSAENVKGSAEEAETAI